MKKRFVVLALALLLAGCSDTMVYIPEEAGQVEGVVLYIPMNPEKSSEEETIPTEPVPTQPEETEPEQKHTATVSKKNTATSNKGNTSSNKNNTTNKETVTGSGKSDETQPAPTEEVNNSGQITVTVPVATEPPTMEVPVTEPPATEPPATEIPETEPLMTEPPATEIPETEPLMTEPPSTEIPETEPLVTEPPMTEPPETEPPLYDISDYAVSNLEYAMLDRINEYRLEAELEELWLDEYLCAIASCRAYESSLVWSHTRPDGRGYWTVLADYGYGGGASGELLGYSTGDGAAVVDTWMRSDPHSALLMGGSSIAGIGIYCSGGVIYVALLLI